MNLDHCCRICGWDLGEDPWAGGDPQYTICACCGGEAGVDDISTREARRYLRNWIREGCQWWELGARPPDWSVAALEARLSD